MTDHDRELRHFIKDHFSRERIAIIAITIALIIVNDVFRILDNNNCLPYHRGLIQIMLASTAVFVFWGSVIELFKQYYVALFFSVVHFAILAVCFYYSHYWVEHLIFTICIILIIWRAARISTKLAQYKDQLAEDQVTEEIDS